MSTAGGPRITTDNLVLCLDAHDAKSYPGEPTTNDNPFTLSDSATDGSGQGSVGVRTLITNNHVKIADAASNTRQTHLITGLTASTTYTISTLYKKLEGTPTFRYQIQDHSGSTYLRVIKFTNTAEIGIEDKDGWQLASWTFVLGSDANAVRIWYQDGADYTTYTHSFELKNPQLEAKAYATPYVKGAGSRPTSVNLMIHGNVGTGQSFSDSSASRHSITAGGSATHTNSRSKFGGGSIYFDGSGDFLKIGSSSEWAFSGDFTVDLWVNPQKTSGGGNLVGDYYIGGGSTSPDWQFIYDGTNQRVNFWRGASYATSSSSSVLRDQWSHVALVRSGSGTNNCKIYINGTLDGQGTFTTTVGRGLNLWVGIDGNESAEPYEGYMDEVRVTQGTALWLSNFTPPKRRTRIGGAWMNRAAGTDGLAVRSGAAFYGGAATKVAHHSNGQVIEPMSAAIIDCDGTDDWIDTGIILKSTMTFSFWYKSESTTAGRVLNVAAWHASSPNRWFELMITDNYATNMLEIWGFGYNTSREDFLPTTSYPNYPAATLNWRNITISFSNGTGTCYLDGVLQGSDAGAFTDFDGASNHSTFWLGRGRNYHYNNANSYTYKDCQIGQFHVWEKALTAAEAKANFNAHRGRYGI